MAKRKGSKPTTSKPSTSKAKEPTSLDPALLDAHETDIVIPIMGATGAGMSTFINILLQHIKSTQPGARVGYQLASCTAELESVVIEGQTIPPRSRQRYLNITSQHRIVILDTPGFDGTTACDFQILRHIAKWLQESFCRKMILGGVIYLHDISQDGSSGTARRNLDMFSHLCGEAALNKVVLVTTKWGRHFGRNFEARERELRVLHWQAILPSPPARPLGAHVMRLVHEEEGESAWKIVRYILVELDKRLSQKALDEVLQIQDELVRKKKSVPETEAAKRLREQLQAALTIQEQMLALEARAAEGEAEAEAKLEEREAKLVEMRTAIQENKVSLFARLPNVFKFKHWFS